MDKDTFIQVGNLLQNQDFIISTATFLGKGRQGTVFECKRRHPANQNEQLCAKVSSINQENENLALQETEIQQSLENENNKNLVKIFLTKYQNGTQMKALITIMERCSSNLQQCLNNNQQQMNEEVVEDFLKQILFGYRSLYEKNIVHRDLKPENILLSSQENQIIYKIADFGIGKVCKFQDKNKDLTNIGTPAYSSPESNKLCDPKDFVYSLNYLKQSNLKNWKSQCDIYSIGLLVYAFMYRKLPFQEKQSSLLQFFNTLKSKTFTLPVNFQFPLKNEKIINFLKTSLVYLPHERITFEKAFEQFEIPYQSKIKTFNQFNSTPGVGQQQFSSKLFTPQADQTAFKNFSTIVTSLQVNVYEDSSKYLKQQLAQNEQFFCPYIKNWFQSLIIAIGTKDKATLQINKEELQKQFVFSDETQRNCSLDYLKFVFSINYLTKQTGFGVVETIHKFQHEQDLKENIKKLLN